MCRWYLILKITQQKWIILPATVDHKQYLLVHVSSYGLVWSELDFELVDIRSVNKRQCLVLSEQSFLGSFSAPYSTVIDFTKLFEEINLDSSCGCQKLLVPLVPCSQWNFSLPTLVLQLISPPLLVLFHLPFGLAKAAAGQHSPKTQLWVLFQATDEQNCCSPLLKGNGEPSPALTCAFRTGLPCPQAVILWWYPPSPCLSVPPSTGIFSLATSPNPCPWRLLFCWICCPF